MYSLGYWSLSVPRGVLGYKRDGGGGGGVPTEPNILHPKKYMDLILCTHKNTRLEILDLKKYMTFFIAEELLAWRKFEPKKIHG